MRKLIRILAGVALLSAAALGPSPAFANHGTGTPPSNPAGGYHEEMPELAVPTPADLCIVSGQVLPGDPFDTAAHSPEAPLVNDDPSHSHFTFVESIINCTQTGPLAVDATGGNDGHMLDILGVPDVVDTTPLELDPVTDDSAQHEFDAHHGSVNESAWSNSSTYDGGQGGGHSNACADGQNNNKGDISIIRQSDGAPGKGWVKYVRVGVVVYAWGCFNQGSAAGANNHFGSTLVILPDLVPAQVDPFLPGTGTPTCVLEFAGLGPACGFILAGTAVTGPNWLVDLDR